jgi:hypothetical protein
MSSPALQPGIRQSKILLMPPKFVIQKHVGHGTDHYDFMLRMGPSLATWQIHRLPQALAVGECEPARKLPDHRLAYLTYEGEVSRGRGRVCPVAAGEYELVVNEPDRCCVDLKSPEVHGRFQLMRQTREDDWFLRRLSD